LFFRPTNSLSNSFLGVGNNTDNNQTKAAFVYGGGVDFDLTRYVAFRPEYRGLVYKIPDSQVSGLAPDAFTHTAQPSVGLVWRF
jgi:opacity protein-like surface antigen